MLFKAKLIAIAFIGAFNAQAQSIGSYVQPASPENPNIPTTLFPTGTPLPKPGGSFYMLLDEPLPITPPTQEKRRVSRLSAGLAASFKNSAGDGPSVGFYRNAEHNTSVYAGYAWSWQIAGPVSVQMMVGGVTGYTSKSVSPLIMPSVALAVASNVALRLSVVAKEPKRAQLGLDFMF